ncbi:MAG: hypothetical protein CMK83_00595 [Pseudomonadales bacterium]|nr:hypothetical protein [Pseudomonadales bacterium]MBI26517.1 hypothetical protein [Pseudomonadales bacterium]|tara:strand:+ start:267 stop:527 length:261 start_codon:yes stop_codon:yes gene_type:complete
MNVDIVVARVKEIVTEILEEEEDLDPNISVHNFGLDSVKAASICMAVEEEYDAVIPVEYFLDDRSITELAQYVISQSETPSGMNYG